MDNSHSNRPFVSPLLMHFIFYQDTLYRYHFSTMDSNLDSKLYGNKRQNMPLLFGEPAVWHVAADGSLFSSLHVAHKLMHSLSSQRRIRKIHNLTQKCEIVLLSACRMEVRRWTLQAGGAVSEPGLRAERLPTERLRAERLRAAALNRVSELRLWPEALSRGSEKRIRTRALSKGSEQRGSELRLWGSEQRLGPLASQHMFSG